MTEERFDRVARLEKNGLIRKLGVTDLFAVGYGDLGSSIYYALGLTAFFALGAAPISLLLAGIVFVCTSLTYAEMTAALSSSGGSANFSRVAFNDLISFIAGWGLLLDFIVTIAISIFSVAPYLAFLVTELNATSIHIGFSIGLIGILYVMNFFGVHHATRISIFLTGFALITQVIIILIAAFSGTDFSAVFQHMKINIGESWSPTWSEFWKGTAMAMVAYTGIESIAALGAETKLPIKTLPRAVIITMTVLIIMYFGISIVGLSVMTPQQLGKDYINDPIAGIVENLSFGSKVLGPWIGILAAAILFVAGNAGLMGASRLAFNMGEFYQLPQFFHQTHKRYRTPVISLAIFSILAALVILISRGELRFLADLYNFGAMIAFCSAHLSLIALRIKKPDLERPFRAPLNIKISKDISIPITAIIGALATFAVWVLVVISKPEGRYMGLVWMGLGLGMYILYRRKKRIAPMAQVQVEKIKMPGYKPIEIKKILVPTHGVEEIETVQIASELAKMHHAKLIAINIIQIPLSIPIDAPLPYRQKTAEAMLQRAKAIAEEYGVEMETEIVRTREIEEAILQYLITKHCDMLVLGSFKSPKEANSGIGIIAERILKKAPCRVVITSSFAIKMA